MTSEECKASLSSATPRPIRSTSACHRCLHVRPEYSVAATRPERLAAPHLLLQETQPGSAKYSAHDRELLAIFEAARHFRQVLEARHFSVFTDHYAFQQKQERCSPRQFNHAYFTAQFRTDIRHISGQENVAADAISRVESVTALPYHPTSHWPHRRTATTSSKHS